MTLEFEHRGYACRYSENSDNWKCWGLDIEADKISTLKAKIDRVVAKARKLGAAVPALSLDYSGVATPIQIQSIAESRREDQPAVWAIRTRRERYFDHVSKGHAWRDIEERKKYPLADLIHDTPENAEKLEIARRLRADAKQMESDAHDLEKAATRWTLAELMGTPANEKENDDA